MVSFVLGGRVYLVGVFNYVLCGCFGGNVSVWCFSLFLFLFFVVYFLIFGVFLGGC